MSQVPETSPLDALNTDQVRELYDSVVQDIQNLRAQWASLSVLADPAYDQEIQEIFARLNQLEYEFLPVIEQRLNQPCRAIERAA